MEAEDQLEVERALMVEERRKVEKIRRECEDPFVVPALLDAFEQVSALVGDIV